MAIPSQLTYTNEDEFNQQFVIPLLHRLGYSVVANYHGQAEFGKDLVFAEIDRFGHVRFHAVQTKYVQSISLNAVEELILDCNQAFANEFRHPQTGSIERVSSFYAINGGSISDQAIQHFFTSLQPRLGGNVRILQAKDLLVLDRWSTAKASANSVVLLTGLLLEIRFNRRQLQKLQETMTKSVAANQKMHPFTSVKTNATSAYLTAPTFVEPQFIRLIEDYWSLLSVVIDLTASFRARLGRVRPDQADLLTAFVGLKTKVDQAGLALETILTDLLARLSAPSTSVNNK